MIRAFLAVQLSEPLRTTLAAVQSEVKRRITPDMPRDVSVSWVRPASMHLTVKFLGDIAEELVMPLRDSSSLACCGSGHPHNGRRVTARRGWRRCTARSRHAVRR